MQEDQIQTNQQNKKLNHNNQKLILKFVNSNSWSFFQIQQNMLSDILNYLQNKTQANCEQMMVKKTSKTQNKVILKLLRCLQNICFKKLQFLSFDDIQICNIQFLTKMDCKNLNTIFLYTNTKISKFQKSMRKCTLSYLKIINIQANRILQANKLSQLWTKHQFESIVIQMIGKSVNQIQDLNFICKLQSKSLQRLSKKYDYQGIMNFNRIQQFNLNKMLIQKRFTKKEIQIFCKKDNQ